MSVANKMNNHHISVLHENNEIVFGILHQYDILSLQIFNDVILKAYLANSTP